MCENQRHAGTNDRTILSFEYKRDKKQLYGIVKSYLGTHDSYRSDALMADNNIYIIFIFMINNFELIFLMIYFIYTL